MSHADFVHLRVHSAYSLSEGAIKVEQIAALAREAAMPAVAITDSGNLFGALEFSEACAASGVQPIIGCQLGLTRPELAKIGLDPFFHIAPNFGPGEKLVRWDANRASPPDPIVLLAQNEGGLRNLQFLSSRGFLEPKGNLKPQVPIQLVCERSEGLLLLTGGGAGPIARLLAEGRRGEAAHLLGQFAEAFADRCIVELQRHNSPAERAVEPGLIALADEAGLPLVATNDCFFAAPDMHAAHDALLCIAEGKLLADADRQRVTPEHWFKPAAAMREMFADLPEACDNTLAIARRCAVMAEARPPLLPAFPKTPPGVTEAAHLRAMALERLAARLDGLGCDSPTHARYRERLEYELAVIANMGFDGYFLIVADFVQWARHQGIPVGPGRGSGAGSVVAWALTITDLDPLRFDLLFERFLNPERVSMPDFDIDFCQDRRDEVIAYVRRAYGGDDWRTARVAQIITFGKLQARAVVRDVGRVLGLPYGQVNKIAELIPYNPARPLGLQQAIEGEPRLQQMRGEDEAVSRLLEIALQLEGLYRHASTHAAGVVIGDRPLIELVPLYRDPRSDFLVTQYSMKYVEHAGLIKFDFLGLTTLTILQRAVEFLGRLGVQVDLNRLPLDDARTYEMLSRGDAGGVFQLEGQGTRDVLRQMRPDRFEDLIAAVALYRPGPMANIPAYCQRKHGEPWEAPHPDIRGILEETYGIMVYQEQVMQIAQKLAGYSLARADSLRRAMGKKIRAEMEMHRKTFIEGAVARGVAEAKAGEIFDLMAKFADYGFNKSHAAAYALVAYQTAWMRANHPVAFLAACMSLAITNTERLAALRQEASGLGVALLPPDINRSEADFTPERQADGTLAIRYALAAVKKVGVGAMRLLIRARRQQPVLGPHIDASKLDPAQLRPTWRHDPIPEGPAESERPFNDIADFVSRVDGEQLNKLQLENLVKAGSFDSLCNNRARLFAGIDTIIRAARAATEERWSWQFRLFGISEIAQPFRLPDVPDWLPMERLAFEAEAIGFHLTAHPLDAYAKLLRRLGVVPSNRLVRQAAAGATRLKLAGSVIDCKERMARSGNRMAWLRLSDSAGAFEATVFSEVLARSRELLQQGRALLVTADVRLEGETLRITAQELAALDQVAADVPAEIRIWLERTEAVPHIRAILAAEAGGKGRVVLVPRLGAAGEVEITLPGRFNVTPRLTQVLQAIPGVARVEEA